MTIPNLMFAGRGDAAATLPGLIIQIISSMPRVDALFRRACSDGAIARDEHACCPFCFAPLKRDTGPEVSGDCRDELRDAESKEKVQS